MQAIVDTIYATASYVTTVRNSGICCTNKEDIIADIIPL